MKTNGRRRGQWPEVRDPDSHFKGYPSLSTPDSLGSSAVNLCGLKILFKPALPRNFYIDFLSIL
jgi:hypothetical protein